MSILDRIVERKRMEVAQLPSDGVDVASLRELIAFRGGVRDFEKALRSPRAGDVGLIAEVKKASPSLGLIRPDFDALAIARTYERAGASCLSVLTDEEFFQGSLENLRRIRSAVHLPLLRKDFVIDARQIREAIEWGADAILLIVAILPDEQLSHFHELAVGAGLGVLVEVHDEVELERALRVRPMLLGVNNRDLRTFKVSLETTERLSARVRSAADWGPLLVAESGIHTRENVVQVRRGGAGAILVGESLMKARDIESQARSLLGLSADVPIEPGA